MSVLAVFCALSPGFQQVDVQDPHLWFRRPQPARIQSASPFDGEAGVALTRETILTFSEPLAIGAVDPSAVYATFGGASLNAQLHVSADRRRLTLFYQDLLPASAAIVATVRGDLLLDENGHYVDADADGVEGGTGEFVFSTLSNVAVLGTSICGRVFASELGTAISGSPVDVPLEGVRISVDGAEDTLFTFTDALGNFRLEPAPGTKFFVHIDGSTAQTSLPAGAYYPTVGKAWSPEPGQETTVGEIYLPLVKEGTLQPVSASAPTTIAFPSAVLQEHPELVGTEVVVPAGSLFANDGTPGSSVGIAPVSPDRLPGVLPEGLDLPLVITIQTDGSTNFDEPVPVRFPNLPDPETQETPTPGTILGLWSFNHDKGAWEVVGPMRVTDDGLFVESEPGVGVLAPGWHGTTDGNQSSGRNQGTTCQTSAAVYHQALLCGVELAYDMTKTAVQVVTVLTPSGAVAQVQIINGVISAVDVVKTASDCLETINGTPNPDYQACVDLIKEVNSQKTWLDTLAGYFSWLTSIAQKLDKIDQSTTSLGAEYYACASSQLDTAGVVLPPAIAAAHAQVHSLVAQAGQQYAAQAPLWASAKIKSDALDVTLAGFMDDAPPLFGLSEAEWDLAEAQLADLETDLTLLASQPSYIDTIRELFEAWIELTTLANQDLLLEPGVGVFGAIENAEGNGFVDRFEVGPFGAFTRVVAPGAYYRATLLNPVTLEVGMTGFISGTPGQTTELPLISLGAEEAGSDTDGDGLGAVGEFTVGTDPELADSDADGIPDGTEVQLGLDPLEGIVVQTGVIAAVPTPGTAVDVAARDDVVALAGGEAGLSLFNVFNAMEPVLVAQVDTPGDARQVDLDGTTAVVADGPAGVVIIDFSAPLEAKIVHQIPVPGQVETIATAGGLAYAGLSTGVLLAIELETGAVVESVELGEPVRDLAVAGDVLFAASLETLFSIPLGDNPLVVEDSIPTTGGVAFPGGTRLFAGAGRAYVTRHNGLDVFDVSDPAAMAILEIVSAPQNGWRQFVRNGSGWGIGVVGALSIYDESNINLYNLTSPPLLGSVQTTFSTPGQATAVGLYNGLAYVADATEGLQVLNYLPFDSGPTFPTVPVVTGTPSQLLEGTLFFLEVLVGDDVQVRNVELWIDGVHVQTDGNFPFEFYATAPMIDVDNTFSIELRASDTGGKWTSSGRTLVSLRPDTTPPAIVDATPAPGSSLPSAVLEDQGFLLRFSEPVDPKTIHTGSVTLEHAGADNLFGTPDDSLVTVSTGLAKNDQTLAVLPSSVPAGELRLRLDGAIVADVAENFLDGDGDTQPGGDYLLPVTATDLDVVLWAVDIDGDWSNGANWSTGSVPAPEAHVFIDRLNADVTVRVDTGITSVASLVSNEILSVTGGELSVAAPFSSRGGVRMEGGVLSNSTVLGDAMGSALVLTSSGGTLRSVVLDGNALADPSASLTVEQGCTLNGELDLSDASAATLTFAGTQVLNGVGTVRFGIGAYDLLQSSSGVLTLGTGITLLGGRGRVVGDLQLHGSVIADGVGSGVWLEGSWTQDGLVTAANGGRVRFLGSWDNGGTASLAGGTLELNGSYDPSLFGVITGDGNIDLAGDLTLPGTLDVGTGQQWNLAGCTVTGGTIENGELELTASSTLDGVRLDADLRVPLATSTRTLTVLNNLNLNGTVTTELAISPFFAAELLFPGSQVLSSSLGTGEIYFDNVTHGWKAATLLADAGGHLTIGPSVLVHGAGFVGRAGSSVTNQGTIRADIAQSSRYLMILGDFANQGLVEATDGAELRLSGTWTNVGAIGATSSTLLLDGVWSNAGSITTTNSTVVFDGDYSNSDFGSHSIDGTIRLSGSLTNTVLDLSTSTATWEFSQLTVLGGTIVGGNAVVTSGTTLDNVRLDADLAVNANTAVAIENGLDLNGELRIHGAGFFSGYLAVPGAQLLASSDGTGVVVLDGTLGKARIVGDVFPTSGHHVTIDSSLLVRGSGTIGNEGLAVTNAGEIRADDTGDKKLEIAGAWTNTGTIAVESGSTLTFSGDWSNAGVVEIQDGSLLLHGTYESADLGVLTGSGGIIGVNGELTNTVLDLGSSSADWHLNAVTLIGGVVTNGTMLTGLNSTLQGVQFDADLLLTYHPSGPSVRTVTAEGGLTLNGTITMTAGVCCASQTELLFPGVQSLDGTGQVLLQAENHPQARAFVRADSGGHLTIESGILLSGRGEVGRTDADLTNRGTLRADFATLPLEIDGLTILNEGIIEASGGDILVTGPWSESGTSRCDTGALLHAASDYDMAPASVLDIELELGGTHGQLQVDGAATLSGALEVRLAPGYTPTVGDEFVVLTAGSLSGTLAPPTPPPGASWSLVHDYGLGEVRLSVAP